MKSGKLISGIGRDFSPRYPTHRRIMLLSAAAGAVGLLVAWAGRGMAPLAGLALALTAGGSCFVAWVLSRELDPDHPGSAFVGAVLVVPVVLAGSGSGLLLAAWQVLVLRIANRTTGVPARPWDSLLVVGLALWLNGAVHPVIGLLTAAAMIADGALEDGHGAHLIIGGTVGFFSLIWLLWLGPAALHPPPAGVLFGGLLVVACFVGWALSQGPAQARPDYRTGRLSPGRVRAGQLLAGLIVLGLLVALGAAGVWQSLPLWASLVGVWLAAVGRWGRRLVRQHNHEEAKVTKE